MTENSTQTTDPQGELLTQVDAQNHVIGSISRKDAHEKEGIYYRTIYLVIKNGEEKILCQKRSATKDLYPNCWDLSVGGHVNFGKSYPETAVREIEEELGLKITEEDLILKGEILVRLPKSGEFFAVFEYKLKPGEVINANAEEVESTKWMTIEEIKESMADKTLQWYPRPEQVIAALY